MTSFDYTAISSQGRRSKGRIDAVSQTAAERELGRRGFLPVAVQQRVDSKHRRGVTFVSRRTDVTDFICTLAALLHAGLSLERSLEVSAQGAAREDLRIAINATRKHVREGGRLADALADHRDFFPPVAVALMRSAEGGGQLAESMRRLASYLEAEKELRAKLISALIYPALLCTVGGATVIILVLFVLPRFAALLQDAGSDLPRSTAFLIAASRLLTHTFPFLIVGAAILGIAYLLWRNTPEGQTALHAWLLRVPLVGSLRARHAVARFGHTLATLLAGGVALTQALDIAEGSSEDAAICLQIREARSAVQRGESFSSALARSSVFPFGFIRLVQVGEETGEFETVVERAAQLLDSELSRRMARLVTLLEPTLILVFGLVVGFVALALLQAVYGIHAQTM